MTRATANQWRTQGFGSGEEASIKIFSKNFLKFI